ncbi:MAG: Crp/Fnr family transcriptional regulator, partial [Desulfohalobium sp.]
MHTTQTLRQAPLFAGLSEEQLHQLQGISRRQSFERGQTIFTEGTDAAGFYVVLSGRIKIFKLSLEGKEQILHIFGTGEPIGEVPVFAGQTFPANAEALDKAEVAFFPRQKLVDLYMADPSLAMNMLAVLSQRLRE